MSLALCVGAGAAIASGIAYYVAQKGVAFANTNPARVKEPSLAMSPLAAFPWGNEAFTMQLIPPIMAFGSVVTAAAIAFTTPSGPITSLELARGPVLATMLWVWGIFNCVSAQLKVKMGGGDEQAKRVAERSLYNTLEQGLPFLTCLWMSAACVDAAIATSVGVVYAAFRMCAPSLTLTSNPSVLCLAALRTTLRFDRIPHPPSPHFWSATLVAPQVLRLHVRVLRRLLDGVRIHHHAQLHGYPRPLRFRALLRFGRAIAIRVADARAELPAVDAAHLHRQRRLYVRRMGLPRGQGRLDAQFGLQFCSESGIARVAATA